MTTRRSGPIDRPQLNLRHEDRDGPHNLPSLYAQVGVPPSSPHGPSPNPRFSSGMISYRTDSPDSSLCLARVPSIYQHSSHPFPVVSHGGFHETGRPAGGGRGGHEQSDSLVTGITGQSLPSSLAHHIEEQRAAIDAAILAERRLRGAQSQVEMGRSVRTYSPLDTPLWTTPSAPGAGAGPDHAFSTPFLSGAPVPISPSDSVSVRAKLSSSPSRPNRKSSTSTKSYSSLSSAPASQVYRAQHARRVSASSHNLLDRASISSLVQAAAAHIGLPVSAASRPRARENEGDGERLNRDLGALPWPELPPRSPSHRSTPSTPNANADASSFLFPTPTPNMGDRRIYSFLESDPLPSGPPTSSGGGSGHSRRSSHASSIGSGHSRSASRGRTSGAPPKDVPLSPALSSWSGSGHMHSQDQRFSHLTLGGFTSECTGASAERPRPFSAYSGMADVASIVDFPDRAVSISISASASASAKSGSGVASAGTERTKSSSSKRSKSMRSAKSGKSGKSKRISIGSNHYRLGKWEIEQGVPLVPGQGEGEWRDVEEKMDLERLLARSLFLEKMLRSGKRISAHSFKKTLQRRITASTKRSSLSTSHKAPSSLSHARPSLPHTASNASGPSAFQPHRSRQSSSSTSIARMRDRLSRKILHRASQEDAYTEIGSVDHRSVRTSRSADRTEEDDPTLFPAPARPPSLLPAWAGARGVRHTGVTVFSEQRIVRGSQEPTGPPTPPKPAALTRKLRAADMGCLTPNSCIPHYSPSNFDYSVHETTASTLVPHPSIALRESYDGPYAHSSDAEKGEVYRQSPHLGHHSPGWRDRRASLASYISTGHWDGRTQKRWIWGVVIGGGLLLILIIGLVSGLLGRRAA